MASPHGPLRVGIGGPVGSGNVTNTWSYTAGTPGQIVVIRLIYQLTTIKGPLGFVLSSLSNGKMEVMGVTAIRVEPS